MTETTNTVSLDDIITNGKQLSVYFSDGFLRVERIAAWLVVENRRVRHFGRIDDERAIAAARDALAQVPLDAKLAWHNHPLACIDPLVTPGYTLDFSTWRYASYWMLKLQRTDDGRVRISEHEQWLEGPPGVERVTDEKKTEDIVDVDAARARAEQELAKLTPTVNPAS